MTQEKLNKRFPWELMMIFVTVFQVITAVPVIFGDEFSLKAAALYGAYIVLEWGYFVFASAIGCQNNFELETIGFLFSGIGMTICASGCSVDYAVKQGICNTYHTHSYVMGHITPYYAVILTVRAFRGEINCFIEAVRAFRMQSR